MDKLLLELKSLHDQQYRLAKYESIKIHSRIILRDIEETFLELSEKAPVGSYLDWHCLTVSHFENDKFEFTVSVHFSPIDVPSAFGLHLYKKLPINFSREAVFEALDVLEKSYTFYPRNLPDDFKIRDNIGNWDCLTRF